MGLFSTLLNANNVNSSETKATLGSKTSSSSSSTTTPSTADLPTVIQLFSKYPIPIAAVDTAALALDLLDSKKQQAGTSTTANTSSTRRKTLVNSRHALFAPLHYFAVQCHTSDPNDNDNNNNVNASGGTRNKHLNKALMMDASTTKLLTPDLGVWNCRADGSAVSDALVPMATGNSTTTTTAGTAQPLFCLVVDLTLPLYTVETNINTIQQALVRYLIQHSPPPSRVRTESTIPDANQAGGATTSTTRTTSQYMLQTVQFGLADKDEKGRTIMDSTTAAPSTTDDTKDDVTKQTLIALCICVVGSNHGTNDDDDGADETDDATNDYKTQQLRQLLTYHLRKYASALHATLIFCQDGNSSTSRSSNAADAALETGDATDTATTTTATTNASVLDQRGRRRLERQPTVTTWELPIVWRALASGIPVWKYESVEAIQGGAAPPLAESELALLDESSPTDKDNVASDPNEPVAMTDTAASTTATTTTSGYSLIYGPDNHNPELIETVLLRNASFPGQWDASTDSVWKVLPALHTPSTIKTTITTTGGTTGDQHWLSELRESVTPSVSDAGFQTPLGKTKGSGDGTTETATGATAKTPNDEAVSSFFADLLK